VAACSAGAAVRDAGDRFQVKILRPLLWFGLLEHRSEKSNRFDEHHFYRKAGLFDRMLTFDIFFLPLPMVATGAPKAKTSLLSPKVVSTSYLLACHRLQQELDRSRFRLGKTGRLAQRCLRRFPFFQVLPAFWLGALFPLVLAQPCEFLQPSRAQYS
jgi:hypothetical protein